MPLGLQPLQPSMTLAQMTSVINQNMNLIDSVTTSQVFRDYQGTNRIQIGKGTDDNYRILVSKPGVDVTTNKDDNQFLFNSSQNNFKIAKSGTGTITATGPGDTAYVDIPHNLGIQPAVLFYGYPPDGAQFWGPGYAALGPVYVYGLSGGYYVVDSFMTASATTTDVRIQVSRSTSSKPAANGVWTYKYFILQESATS